MKVAALVEDGAIVRITDSPVMALLWYVADEEKRDVLVVGLPWWWWVMTDEAVTRYVARQTQVRVDLDRDRR